MTSTDLARQALEQSDETFKDQSFEGFKEHTKKRSQRHHQKRKKILAGVMKAYSHNGELNHE